MIRHTSRITHHYVIMFHLVYSDNLGQVYDSPNIEALGFDGRDYRKCFNSEMIPLPFGTCLNLMPERFPLGNCEEKLKVFKKFPYVRGYVSSVSALLPNGYTRLLLPAYKERKRVRTLPLFAYTCVAFKGNSFYVAAHETEKSEKWNPLKYNTDDLKIKIEERLKKEPFNRLIRHLSHCALFYQCYNAQNIFYCRWEGGIPLSSGCNAACLGCISFQKKNTSPQERIAFTPSIDEILSAGVKHLQNASEAILSFGQGCEGEPTLKGDLLVSSIKAIRNYTDRGTIHLNTNGSRPEVIKEAIRAGLDSIRIGLNSAIENNYMTYFLPQTYSFKDVKTAINLAKESGIFVSLNLLVMPGFTDREEEIEALFNFLEENPVHMVQLRNLNIDPYVYFRAMPPPGGKLKGMLNFIRLLQQRFPGLKVGSVNPVTSLPSS
ncbi:MAG TPA: radical SAM protein [Candidatus Eremiobacteraeota bacterium]|nr:radical SAM protein [Candidatus Eremiobacteraeota bacterium]